MPRPKNRPRRGPAPFEIRVAKAWHERSERELLGMRLICATRRANLLLDVPPDKHGLIPQPSIDALARLQSNFEKSHP